MSRVAGIIQFQAGGQQLLAKGEFTFNLGLPKRESIVGSDNKVHGFTEKPQAPFIEGEITDDGTVDIKALMSMKDATVTLGLGNGKIVMLRNAFQVGEGTGHTDEGNLGVRFEGSDAEEIS